MHTQFYSMSCLFLIIFTLIHVPRCWCAEDEQYVTCGDRLIQCGDFLNIGYPFWGVNRPKYCGHPGLMLNCQNRSSYESLELTIQSITYRVIEINYASQTLTVRRKDYRTNSCPTSFYNTTLNSKPFSYGDNTQLMTLYYGCPFIPGKTQPLANEFDCHAVNDTTTNRTYFVPSDLRPNINFDLGTCSGSVIVPVSRSVAEDFISDSSSSTIGEALDGGFELEYASHTLTVGTVEQWKDDYTFCIQCAKSGGQCGFDTISTKFTCFCPHHPHHQFDCHTNGSTKHWLNHGWKIAIGIPATLAGLTLIFILAICYTGRKYLWMKKAMNDHVETFFRNYGSHVPKQYNYSDIKRMTNSFRDKLGQGGYGVVYKGKLMDGQLVAVKVLSETKGNGEEFVNEVATISRTSHVNVVNFLGFSYERNKRALVYEFMSNGSLDKFIYNDGSPNSNCHLDCKILYQIAIGVARGLEYLHRGCSTRIVHFDIKPHNILLDDDFCPKIADFGLAKLGQRKESIMSMVGTRGTIGYIAPEVFFRKFGGVSHKSDVYSYGMMVLEMVGGRNDIEAGTIYSSEKYFPDCIYERLEHGEDLRPHGVTTEEEKETVRKMTIVSLWCIQTNPADRPPMTNVVEMLEGNLQSLQIPPKPILASPPR